MTGEFYSAMVAISLPAEVTGTADSLLFAGGGNERGFTPGSFVGTGAFSVAVVVKRTGWDGGTFAYTIRWNLPAGSDPLGIGMADIGAGQLCVYDGTNERFADPTIPLNQDEWYLIGISKAAGTVTPRYHVYRYSTSEWEHGNFGGTIANFGAPTTIVWAQDSGQSWVGNMLIGAVWDSDLADATFETLELDKASWYTAAPDEAYRFDTAGTITPFVGTGSQNTSNGATLDTGDAPAGWSDAGEEAPAEFGLYAHNVSPLRWR
jgi:hypothetical protein